MARHDIHAAGKVRRRLSIQPREGSTPSGSTTASSKGILPAKVAHSGRKTLVAPAETRQEVGAWFHLRRRNPGLDFVASSNDSAALEPAEAAS